MGATTTTTATSCCRGGDGGGIGGNRVCDSCRAAASAVYCRADGAYLCKGCDARIHDTNLVASRSHERVWLCDSCERAPAAFVCKADAASLCVSCDADIHSANPLASRHHRVPVLPIGSSGCVYPGEMLVAAPAARCAEDGFDQEDEDEAASWMLLSNPGKNNQNNNNGMVYNGDVDEYLDLMEYNDNQFNGEKYNQQQQYELPQKSYGGDSVVPVQFTENKDQFRDQKFQLEVMSYDSSKTAYSYNSPFSQTVSISSVDIGIVPESTSSHISMSHSRPPKGTIDLISVSSAQFNPLDREARVQRYREKKKTRKFEKTVRYASRKAYAETRPRIKGRFAKRTDMETEVDQMFSSSLMAENGYGIVPSY